LERATVLLAHGLKQSDIPISQVFRDAFARDIAVCIESLQFHDRLVQQLTQARDLLTGLAPNPRLPTAPGLPAHESSIAGSVELF
jgi:hypothetical protein